MYRTLPFLLLWFVLLGATARPASAQSYSIIIEHGLVHDGSGAPGNSVDIGIVGDRIAAIGDLSAASAAVRIDAEGLVVAPGFIDIHSHMSSTAADSSPVALRPIAENYLRQGVTAAFGGQDGSSPIDIGKWLAYFDAKPSSINVGMFVGHGSVRAEVVGQANVAPTAEQMRRMRTLIVAAMVDGAFGLSSGLEYTPGSFADTEELVDLASVIAPFDGLYISHVRDEGGMLMASVEEVIEIARRSGAAGQLTHHKIIGKGRWGGTVESLARVDAAREASVDISIDVYPYTASSTNFTILFPQWSKDGGFDALVERLRDDATRERILSEVIEHITTERGADPSTIVAARCTFDPSLDGKSLADMARDRGMEVTVAHAAEIALDVVEKGSCQGVFHSMSEEDVARVLAHPMTMLASDGGIPAMGVGMPHPRNYGSFARLFAKYVRTDSVLSLSDAIRKVTSLPAERLGLEDRGIIRLGAFADLVIFDPATLQDHATFAAPHQFATGIREVIVNGQIAMRSGEPTGIRSGRALRK